MLAASSHHHPQDRRRSLRDAGQCAALQGFSLVEMSFVLVILGLILGGILTGQALQKNQRLRSIAVEAGNYTIAMNQFKVKYGFLAGDMPTATEIWGRADGGSPLTSNCAAPDTTASSGTATCNGNGDGNLTASTHEATRAWQHLVAGGFLEGRYTGIAPLAFGSSLPRGPLEATGFAWNAGPIIINNDVTANTQYYDGDYSNMLTFGKLSGGALSVAAMSAPQMAELDCKSEDGFPASGAIRSYKPAFLANCAVGTTLSATYDLAASGENCIPLFLPSFKTTK